MRGLRSLFALLSLTSLAMAADRPVRIAVDPAKAGPDFATQGEYEGQLGTGEKMGVQVVAQGEGKFKAVVFFGGLPGNGGEEEEPLTVDGETVDGVTTFASEEGKGVLVDGVITVYDADDQELGKLNKVERKSPTLGAAPPEGAVVLFDGTSAEQFQPARIMPDKSLPAGVVSKPKFGDCKLHIEFKTPFMPTHRGQNRGNSGVYLQSRYEVQVLDSFGLPEKDNECGGLYGFHEPLLNMCFPPLSWQTYDIEFHQPKFDADGKKTANARLTVELNGVKVQDNVELPHESGQGQAESPEPGPLLLQFHLCPVAFRNVWYVPLSAE